MTLCAFHEQQIWVYVYGSTFVRRQACGPDFWYVAA